MILPEPFFTSHRELCRYLRRREIGLSLLRALHDPAAFIRRLRGRPEQQNFHRSFLRYSMWTAAVRDRLRALPSGFVTTYSLHPETAHFVYEFVQRHQCRTVLECGCGISTIVLALAGEMLSGKIVSLENEPRWFNQTRLALTTLRLEHRVALVHAPLEPIHLPGATYLGYSTDRVPRIEADLLFIDAPAGAIGRGGVLPSLMNFLKSGAIILLDDARRKAERDCVAEWQALGFASLVGYGGLGQGVAVLERR